MKKLWIIVLVAGLFGCQSDAKTLERLQGQATLDSLDVEKFERKADSVERAEGPRANIDQWLDSLSAAKNRLALTQREYNKFMH